MTNLAKQSAQHVMRTRTRLRPQQRRAKPVPQDMARPTPAPHARDVRRGKLLLAQAALAKIVLPVNTEETVTQMQQPARPVQQASTKEILAKRYACHVCQESSRQVATAAAALIVIWTLSQTRQSFKHAFHALQDPLQKGRLVLPRV